MKVWGGLPARSTLTTKTVKPPAPRCLRPTASDSTSRLMAHSGPNRDQTPLWSIHMPPPSIRPRLFSWKLDNNRKNCKSGPLWILEMSFKATKFGCKLEKKQFRTVMHHLSHGGGAWCNKTAGQGKNVLQKTDWTSSGSPPADVCCIAVATKDNITVFPLQCSFSGNIPCSCVLSVGGIAKAVKNTQQEIRKSSASSHPCEKFGMSGKDCNRALLRLDFLV